MSNPIGFGDVAEADNDKLTIDDVAQMSASYYGQTAKQIKRLENGADYLQLDIRGEL